jgi:hypothetical protein
MKLLDGPSGSWKASDDITGGWHAGQTPQSLHRTATTCVAPPQKGPKGSIPMWRFP